jgi:hypothetical protein
VGTLGLMIWRLCSSLDIGNVFPGLSEVYKHEDVIVKDADAVG